MMLLAWILLGGAGLALHGVLVLTAAPFVAVLADPAETVRSLVEGGVRRPLRELAVLLEQGPVRAANGSGLADVAPALAVALTLVGAMLVPSFALGLPTAPLADLLLLLGLLLAVRLLLVLAAFDSGVAASGLAAVGLLISTLLAVPGAVLGLLGVVSQIGVTGLEPILSRAPVVPLPGMVVAASALGLAALAAGGGQTGLRWNWSGRDLGLLRFQSGLQLVVWIDLVGALVWPSGLIRVEAGPLAWLVGLLCWGLRLGLGCLLVRLVAMWLPTPAARRRLAAMSLLLAVMSPLLAMGHPGP